MFKSLAGSSVATSSYHKSVVGIIDYAANSWFSGDFESMRIISGMFFSHNVVQFVSSSNSTNRFKYRSMNVYYDSVCNLPANFLNIF